MALVGFLPPISDQLPARKAGTGGDEAGGGPGRSHGRGLHSSTFRLNQRRLCHSRCRAYDSTQSTRVEKCRSMNKLTLSRKVNECKPLAHGVHGGPGRMHVLVDGRGLHSFTFRLDVSISLGTRGALSVECSDING